MDRFAVGDENRLLTFPHLHTNRCSLSVWATFALNCVEEIAHTTHTKTEQQQKPPHKYSIILVDMANVDFMLNFGFVRLHRCDTYCPPPPHSLRLTLNLSHSLSSKLFIPKFQATHVCTSQLPN